jgi:3-hydroxyisobutyrate dehydrogenase-like beta-hydroxyacid dehydrogenase
MRPIETLGFVGLGVMGEPMCANLIRKSGKQVFGTDVRREPVERLAAIGLRPCASVAEVAAAADLVFLSLPSGAEVEAVCCHEGGIVAAEGRAHMVIDMSTSSARLSRELGTRLAAHGITFVDAPVARTRAAARDGTLSIMVGGSPEAFATVRPLLAHMGSEINHCGGVGAGQVVKILNNMIVMVTVEALAEALVTARRAGVDGKVLFDVMSKGSADSFVLRNHGLKSLVPGVFPEDAFPVDYALKDLRLAMELAAQSEVELRGAPQVVALLEQTARAGYAANYFPVMIRQIDK